MGWKGKILVVDDDPGARESIRTVLAPRCDVVIAASAVEAISVLKVASIAAITLEPWLAGVQGRQLLEHLREAAPQSRVILVTSQRLSLWFDDMVREQVFDYVPKPFAPRDLRFAVERALAAAAAPAAPVLEAGRRSLAASALRL